jgi:hypothetical protein
VGEPPRAESSRYLVTARPLNNVKVAFSMWSDPRLYSQGSSEGSQSTVYRVGVSVWNRHWYWWLDVGTEEGDSRSRY